MLRLACILLALLLLAPSVAARHAPQEPCVISEGAIDAVQCAANNLIDEAEYQAQNGIGTVCFILFGEPC